MVLEKDDNDCNNNIYNLPFIALGIGCGSLSFLSFCFKTFNTVPIFTAIFAFCFSFVVLVLTNWTRHTIVTTN